MASHFETAHLILTFYFLFCSLPPVHHYFVSFPIYIFYSAPPFTYVHFWDMFLRFLIYILSHLFLCLLFFLISFNLSMYYICLRTYLFITLYANVLNINYMKKQFSTLIYILFFYDITIFISSIVYLLKSLDIYKVTHCFISVPILLRNKERQHWRTKIAVIS